MYFYNTAFFRIFHWMVLSFICSYTQYFILHTWLPYIHWGLLHCSLKFCNSKWVISVVVHTLKWKKSQSRGIVTECVKSTVAKEFPSPVTISHVCFILFKHTDALLYGCSTMCLNQAIPVHFRLRAIQYTVSTHTGSSLYSIVQ